MQHDTKLTRHTVKARRYRTSYSLRERVRTHALDATERAVKLKARVMNTTVRTAGAAQQGLWIERPRPKLVLSWCQCAATRDPL